MSTSSHDSRTSALSLAVGLGLVVGAALGLVLFDSLVLGAAVGLALGAALGTGRQRRDDASGTTDA